MQLQDFFFAFEFLLWQPEKYGTTHGIFLLGIESTKILAINARFV